MKALFKIPDKGDPSDVLQIFSGFNIEILCCRYWWLKNWEFNELSFPYWRIYYNSNPGAVISYRGKDYNIDPDHIIIIPPNTSFSTRLFDHSIPGKGYVIKGGRIDKDKLDSSHSDKSSISHLFIHFKLGSPYDNVKPGLYIFKTDIQLTIKLKDIKEYLILNFARFDFHSTVTIKSIISDMISKIPAVEWDLLQKDIRILDTINFIENNPKENLANEQLANKVQLATNSFTRLFHQEIGIPPQRFVKKKRADHACVLLHHTQKSIDEIAMLCGFSDRYHFSRIFKQVTGASPALYRKGYKIS